MLSSFSFGVSFSLHICVLISLFLYVFTVLCYVEIVLDMVDNCVLFYHLIFCIQGIAVFVVLKYSLTIILLPSKFSVIHSVRTSSLDLFCLSTVYSNFLNRTYFHSLCMV